MRFSIGRFIILSALLFLLVIYMYFPIYYWLVSISFLFGSLLVFRLIDDAGSVYYDRLEHPERTYLNPKKYPRFLKITFGVTLVYLTVLIFISWRSFELISLLILGSAIGYRLFYKNRLLLAIIPLLKYPVLLACIALSLYQSPNISLVLASFFMMASHDALEGAYKFNMRYMLSMALILICGLLIFEPWLNPAHWLYILPIFTIFPLLSKERNFQIVPVLYYPILSAINNFF